MKEQEQFEAELDAELIEEICQWAEQEDSIEDTPDEYHFTNPDPYAKCEPLPEGQRNHNFWFDEDGHIRVKNLSAYWVPELTLTEVIGGTTYTVTGSYEGTETFVRKLERITTQKFAEKMEVQE